MKTIKNINKSIRVDVMDFLKLYKFLKEDIRWDFDSFYSYLKEAGKGDQYWIRIKLEPKFLLLPNYRYSSIHSELRKIAGIKKDKPYDEVFKLENLSLYNVFEVEEAKESEIKDIWAWVGIDGYRAKNMARISGLGLVIEYKDYITYTGVSISFSYWDEDIKAFGDILKTVKWANNRSYHRFSTKKKGGVAEKIEVVEDSFLAMLNFIYNIHAGGYGVDEFSRILEPIMDMFRSYGNTFEEVIDAMKLAATFIG
jgi:hypothetical protein